MTSVAPTAASEGAVADVRELYLTLLKRALTRYGFEESWRFYESGAGWRGRLVARARRVLRHRDLEIVRSYVVDPDQRAVGADRPPDAETMIGLRRLDNLQQCVDDVITGRVPGDVIETGVWRGGACIFLRGLLKAYGDTTRTVWVADSFRGLPTPAAGRDDDAEDALWSDPSLAVPLAQVQANFARYDLLDEQVRFLPGWFEDTLPVAPIAQLAVMRLDGDMYDSTMVALESLYPKLSVGGYVIIDDYHAVRGCQQAVDDYRARHDITDELVQVDWTCRYWRRSR